MAGSRREMDCKRWQCSFTEVDYFMIYPKWNNASCYLAAGRATYLENWNVRFVFYTLAGIHIGLYICSSSCKISYDFPVLRIILPIASIGLECRVYLAHADWAEAYIFSMSELVIALGSTQNPGICCSFLNNTTTKNHSNWTVPMTVIRRP